MFRRILVALLLLLAGFLAWRLQPGTGKAPVAAPTCPEVVRPFLPATSPAPAQGPETAPEADPPSATIPTAAGGVAFLVGRVICKETGKPFSQRVLLQWRDGEAMDFETDAAGRYRFRAPSGRRYWILIPWLVTGHVGWSSTGRAYEEPNKEDLSPAEWEASTFPPLAAGEERNLDIALSRGDGLDLTATRADTGLPVEHALVHLIAPQARGTRHLVNGRLIEEGLDPDRWMLDEAEIQVVPDEGLPSAKIPLKGCPSLDGKRTLSIQIRQGCALDGILLDPGATPYAGACSLLVWPSGKSLADAREAGCLKEARYSPSPNGLFRIQGLPDDCPSFSLLADGMEDAFMSEPVTAVPDRTVTILLSEGGKLSGKVLDASGKPVPGACVNLWGTHEGREMCRRVSADAKGLYTLPGLPSWPGLSLAAYPPGMVGYQQDEDGGMPIVGIRLDASGKQERILPCGWKDVLPGDGQLDIVIGKDPGLKPYSSR